MDEKNTKTLMRAIDINKFNEDMNLIEKYLDLARKVTRKISVEEDFYIEDIYECDRLIEFVRGYANIIRKNDLESARNYLRTGIANGSTIYLDNISQELREILNNDKYWKESIDKTK